MTGIGLTLDTVKQRIDSHQQRFRRSIYFVDRSGGSSSASPEEARRQPARPAPGAGCPAGASLTNRSNPVAAPGLSIRGRSRPAQRPLSARAGWHLLVEQNRPTKSALQRTLWLNLSISTGITLSVLLLALLLGTPLPDAAGENGCYRRPHRPAQTGRHSISFTTKPCRMLPAPASRPGLRDPARHRPVQTDQRPARPLVGDAVLREVATTIQSFGAPATPAAGAARNS